MSKILSNFPIKKVLLVVLALIAPYPTLYAAVSESTMQDVKQRITQASGIHVPPIRLEQNAEINAYADSVNSQITVFTGLLDFVNSADELAVVLAHEVCHLKHGDIGAVMHQEKRADICGYDLMQRAGYNPQAGVGYWQRLIRIDGDIGPPTHPYSSVRLKFYQTGDRGVYNDK